MAKNKKSIDKLEKDILAYLNKKPVFFKDISKKFSKEYGRRNVFGKVKDLEYSGVLRSEMIQTRFNEGKSKINSFIRRYEINDATVLKMPTTNDETDKLLTLIVIVLVIGLGYLAIDARLRVNRAIAISDASIDVAKDCLNTLIESERQVHICRSQNIWDFGWWETNYTWNYSGHFNYTQEIKGGKCCEMWEHENCTCWLLDVNERR